MKTKRWCVYCRRYVRIVGEDRIRTLSPLARQAKGCEHCWNPTLSEAEKREWERYHKRFN
jgi:hypothetical protein